MRHETGLRPVGASACLRLGGLARGTLVRTPRGGSPVEALACGALVATPGGPAPVLGIEACAARAGPVRIAAGALGGGRPERDLVVGAATRVWRPGARAPVDAWRLVDGWAVTEDRPRGMTFWTVMLPGDALLIAEGVEVRT